MPKNFIEVQRNVSTAIFAADLLRLSQVIRNAVEQVEKVKSLMDSNWTSGDYADLETRFGIPTGQGQTVYGMVRDTQRALKGEGTFADALALIQRVG